MKNKHLLILSILFIFGVFLRFYDLGQIPTGFHRDEAFLGYNAYSILETGRDINGNLFPLHLQSFLYTPAGYSYLSIPFISIFGLNIFAVRFASALFGSLTILLTYLLTKKIFTQSGLTQITKQNGIDYLPLLASFLLTVSPWHINLSRTASVSSLVVFFITLGILLYFYWLETKRTKFVILSFVSYIISLSFYIAPYSFKFINKTKKCHK